MRLLTKFRYIQKMTYPEGILINQKKNNIVVFEKDFTNPQNEGFICFWEITKLNNKQLIFKKRLTKNRAQKQFIKLKNEGWIKANSINKAA